ncbi:P-loop containing nucleoside triphosphate hydrolase [Phytophthora cactorum]|nr:P-loop containing nucleoside triphosphate hydrolase [Phytophthora cactorum]
MYLTKSFIDFPAMATSAPANANEECVGPQSEEAGKADGCAGCPNQSLCASGAARQPDPAVSDVKQRLAGVKHKLLVLSGRAAWARVPWLVSGSAGRGHYGPQCPQDARLLGQEVHQSAAGWSPVYVDDNLGVMSIGFMLPNADDAISGAAPRRAQFLVDVQWGELDYLIIDTPPGTSDEHISIVQYMKEADLDGAVVVTTPQEVALSDVRKELNFCHKTNINVLGVVENMSGVQRPLSDVKFVGTDGNDQTAAFMKLLQEKAPELLNHSVQMEVFPASTGGGEAMAKKFNVPFLGRLPLDNKMTGACEEGVSFLEEYPDSVAAPAFSKIVDDLVAAVEK